MADWIYVDNSNLFIEGRRVSAIKTGMARDINDAFDNGIFDSDYRISFGKLYRFITGSYQAESSRAVVFGSGSLENEKVRVMAEGAGFEVKIHGRNLKNKEKKVDTDITTEMVRDAYRNAAVGDTFNLVAGDKDYVPPVERLISDGMKVDVIFWDHAARELKDVCSNFISLNKHRKGVFNGYVRLSLRKHRIVFSGCLCCGCYRQKPALKNRKEIIGGQGETI